MLGIKSPKTKLRSDSIDFALRYEFQNVFCDQYRKRGSFFNPPRDEVLNKEYRVVAPWNAIGVPAFNFIPNARLVFPNSKVAWDSKPFVFQWGTAAKDDRANWKVDRFGNKEVVLEQVLGSTSLQVVGYVLKEEPPFPLYGLIPSDESIEAKDYMEYQARRQNKSGVRGVMPCDFEVELHWKWMLRENLAKLSDLLNPDSQLHEVIRLTIECNKWVDAQTTKEQEILEVEMFDSLNQRSPIAREILKSQLCRIFDNRRTVATNNTPKSTKRDKAAEAK
jgi:hypothetical protein